MMTVQFWKCLSRCLLVFLWGLASLAQAKSTSARNVVLFIGDGMGRGQIEATARYFQEGAPLSFQRLPVLGEVYTESASHKVTDSAAAATAMATGAKTNNGFIGRDTKTADLPNIFEILKGKGWVTAIATSVAISHATPAGFAAHADDRLQADGIVDSLLSRSRPEILLGATQAITPEWAEFKGYDVVTNRSQLQAYRWSDTPLHLSGQFGQDNLPWGYEEAGEMPRLHEMVQASLRMLDELLMRKQDAPGFFFLVEAGMIDWAGHKENLHDVVYQVRELERAVNVALDWAEDRSDTLIVVTADHETGGLVLKDEPKKEAPPAKSFGAARQLPAHEWTANGAGSGNISHSADPVSLFAWGAGSELFSGSYENTAIFQKLLKATAVAKEAPGEE